MLYVVILNVAAPPQWLSRGVFFITELFRNIVMLSTYFSNGAKTFSIMYYKTQHDYTQYWYAECHYSECHIF